MRRFGTVLLVLALVGGCVAPSAPPPPPPAPPVATAPPPPPPPPPAADWRDRPYTPGDWSYVSSSGESIASYAASTPSLQLRCGAGQLMLDLPGSVAGPVIVRTSYGDTVRQAQPAPGAARLVMPGGDPLADQIAYSRGRFMVSAAGRETIVPAWPEVARVIEDCR